MGNGNSTYDQECAQRLRKFHEAHAAYQAASGADKENYFPRRHAALMLVQGTLPRTRDEIAGVMRVALEELAKDLMIPGRVPDAVAAALGNCLRAIEDIDIGPSVHGAIPSIELTASDSDASSDVLIEIEVGIDKLDKLASLLGYLGKNCGGKEEPGVFFALMNSAEAIREALSTAVDRLMPKDMTRRRHWQ